MTWSDVGTWLTSDGAPWWGTVGAPILTYYIGQRTSSGAAREQRRADAVERLADRKAEAERLAKQQEAEQRSAQRAERSEAFSEALEGIAQLTAELAKAGIERYGEPDDNGSQARILNPEDAVNPDALRQFAGSLARLRLYTSDPVLDIDELLKDLTLYVGQWWYLHSLDHESLIERLQVLSKQVGDLYRLRT